MVETSWEIDFLLTISYLPYSAHIHIYIYIYIYAYKNMKINIKNKQIDKKINNK